MYRPYSCLSIASFPWREFLPLTLGWRTMKKRVSLSDSSGSAAACKSTVRHRGASHACVLIAAAGKSPPQQQRNWLPAMATTPLSCRHRQGGRAGGRAGNLRVFSREGEAIEEGTMMMMMTACYIDVRLPRQQIYVSDDGWVS